MSNVDSKTVEGFGEEWSVFDQADVSDLKRIFEQYFHIFPWDKLPPAPIGADIGAGSGRWAKFVAPNVGILHCVEPSKALQICKKNLAPLPNVVFHANTVDSLPFEDGSLDFAFSLGVLHHVPSTLEAIQSIAKKLKPGAPFLIYLYYAFDNRSTWFRVIWKVSDVMRKGISRLPFFMRYVISQLIALTVYWPLARLARATKKIPLSFYRDKSFYVMRTDALDRFGTRLEQRFTRAEIAEMLRISGFRDIKFSEEEPYWCAVGIRS